jgi:hypothetical protein
MNHPLNRFHRPRSGKGLREWAHAQTPSCRMPDKLGTAAQPTFAAGFSISVCGLQSLRNALPHFLLHALRSRGVVGISTACGACSC